MINTSLSFATIAAPIPWSMIFGLLFAGAVFTALLVIFNRQNALDKRLQNLEASTATPAPAPPLFIAAPANPPAPTSQAPSPPAPAPESSSDEFIFIAAAVHLVLGVRHRIVAVNPQISDNLHWSLEGRRQVFQSHKVR